MTTGGTATVDFELTAAVVRLQDVVTTATGQQRKIELGNAVATLGDVSTRVEQTSITNMSDLLVAKVSGMVVIPGAFTNGAPLIRIRGLNSLSLNNSPIFVVDGVRMNIGGSSSNGGNLASGISVINDIDPSTIEDIEVVKGPSAATLYGTDAANGVVVITTKKGKAGKNRWTFNAEQGSLVDKSNYLTAYMIWGHAPGSTTAARCYTYTISAGTCIADSSSSLNIMTDKTGLSPLATGFRNQWNAQASGGTEAVRYFVSGGLENETGPMKMPDFSVQRLDSVAGGVRPEWYRPEYYQKLNVNTNVSMALSPSIDLDVSAGFSKIDEGLPQTNNNTFSPTYQSMMGPGFKTAGPGYTGIGSLGEKLNGYNSYVPSEIFQDVNQNQSQRLIGSVHASWRPFAWMQNDGTVGVDYNNRTGIFLCRYRECPASGTLRLGATSSSTTQQSQLLGEGHEHVHVAGQAVGEPEDHVRLRLHERRKRRDQRQRDQPATGCAVGRTGRGDGRRATRSGPRPRRGATTRRSRSRCATGSSSPPRSARTRTARSARTSRSVVYPKFSAVVDRVGRVVLPEDQMAGSASPAQRVRRVGRAAWCDVGADHLRVDHGEPARGRRHPDGHGHAGPSRERARQPEPQAGAVG